MLPAAVGFDIWKPFARHRAPPPPAVWTIIGALAIPLWATFPALTVSAAAIPAFEVLALMFAVGWLILSLIEGREHQRERGPGEKRRAHRLSVLACALGLAGTNAFFILATKSIPAAQANLISYLWPVMVVVMGGSVGLYRLRPRHFLGLGLGFAGAAVVLGDGSAGGAMVFSWTGVGSALLAGAAWAVYCVFRLWQGKQAAPVLAQGCGISAFLCAGLHLGLEQTVLPGPGALLAIIAIGVVPLALGNLAWDRGLRHGDSQLLAVMAYATPLVAALFLIAAGMAAPTPNLLAGALMIVTAGYLSTGGKP